ncbi:hypothetical protein JCM5350_000250, partial [Sporobolomyces pararoseus]
MAKKSSTSKGKQPVTTLPTAERTALENDSERWLPVVEVVKINPCSLLELKTCLDDTVKEFFSLPRNNFQISNRHQDVKLLLGWSSVLIALGTTYYSYKKDDFQGTKFLVGLGVGSYVVLNTLLALYVVYYEKNLIWVGKRRTIASRITTEHLSISSTAYSSPTSNSTQSSWIPFPISLLSTSTSPSPSSSTMTTISSTSSSDDVDKKKNKYPLYTLKFHYTHSANANKSLLNQNELIWSKPFGDLFDRQGTVSRDLVEQWLK